MRETLIFFLYCSKNDLSTSHKIFTMPVEIKEVLSKHELRKFINLPAKIHKNHVNWIPPIYMDEWAFFNPGKNKSFSYCDTVLLLAYKENKPVGRIMGIINHKYNEKHGERDARFCFMETYEDKEVYHALINYVENWAREKGMENLVGPLGFSEKDPQGYMVEGFGEPIVIATNGNYEYMVNLLESEGFTKKIDCVVYKIVVPKEIPDFYKKIYERVEDRNNIKVLEFTRREDLKPFIRPVFHLVNETFADIYAFAPFAESEMDDFANRYLLLLDPQYIKVITDEKKEVIAFIIGMPDISKGVKKCKGKILPFGILQIIAARKRSKQLNLLLGAIKEPYRGKGLDVILGVKMLETAQKNNIEVMDSHLELETNTKVRLEMERVGGEVYKKYRIFQKKF